MAVIHKGNHSLNKQARQYMLTVLACILMLLAYGAVFWQGLADFSELEWFYLLLPIVWCGGIVYYWRRYRIFKAGARGEDELLQHLKRLPQSYHVFANYRIVNKRIRDEIDFIVVGTNGVFVIEVKNHVGCISGRVGDIEWQQRKLGKKGVWYTKTMRNPVKQARWHRLNVERLLQQRGFKLSPQVLLAFMNRHVSLDIETDGVFTATAGKEVVDFILKKVTIHKLSGQKIKTLTAALQEYADSI